MRLSYSSGVWTFKEGVSMVALVRALSRARSFYRCPFVVERGRASSLASSFKGTNSSWISSKMNHLPQAPAPKTVTLGARASMCGFGGHNQCVAGPCLRPLSLSTRFVRTVPGTSAPPIFSTSLRPVWGLYCGAVSRALPDGLPDGSWLWPL